MSEILLLSFADSTIGVLTFGFLLGLKHAIESDHLAAVSTIVIETKSLFSSTIVRAIWGLGHTISLLLAGVFVLLLNFQINSETERFLEFCVGLLLILLGLNVLRKLFFGGKFHFHLHEHSGRLLHAHPHFHEREQSDAPQTHHNFSFSPRALIIGMIHGLAGSAALMLLIIPTIDSQIIGMFYILIFGAGSIGGMMLMSFLVGLPLQLTAFRFNRLHLLLHCLAGLASLYFGVFMVYEKGIIEGLLS